MECGILDMENGMWDIGYGKWERECGISNIENWRCNVEY